MPITPGRCAFTVSAGVTVPLCPPFSEKECIEVLKVYDSCVSTETAICVVDTAAVCPGVVIPANATFTCSVLSDQISCDFVAFGPFNPPFFRNVTVLVTVPVTVNVLNSLGVVICTFTATLISSDTVYLWAPTGTFGQCDVLNPAAITCLAQFNPANPAQIVVTAAVCKLISVKALVNLLVPSYGFCETTPCTHQPSPPCPPAPVFPPQRCQAPPTVTVLDGAGGVIPQIGLTVNVIRTANGTTTTIPAITGLLGTATFTTIGGLEGGIDTIQFVDPTSPAPPLPQRLVTFPIPVEFTDILGVLHDSATVCTITFSIIPAVTGVTPEIIIVIIDGFRVLNPIFT